MELSALIARRSGLVTALIAVLLGGSAAGARAQTPGSTPSETRTELIAVAISDRPPEGRRQSSRAVVRVAEAFPKISALRRSQARSYARPYLHGSRLWQVSVFAPRPGRDKEIAQVIIDDKTGGVLEAHTGIQVEWTMARGYPGAFGRKVNALYVWLGLLALFLLPFARRPWRLLHLDLLVLAAFSVSYAFFGAARIGLSVPLAYPCLAYLLVRMLALARARGRGEAFHVKRPLALVTSPGFLAMGVIFLLGFRIGLNVSSSNVIDVGYSGVIGADLLAGGDALYGGFPEDNRHGDTYGPVNYLAYVPFEQLLPWSGTWDDLPAAHAASVVFDLLAAGLLWLIGRRLRGGRLGLLLAYLWLAFPFTLLVANSNANDSLVAVLALAALLVASRPIARGAAVAAAGLTKFAPLALFPLLATYPPGGGDVRSLHLGRRALLTAAGLVCAAAVLMLPVWLADGGLSTFIDRTVSFQADRPSPFSIWGYWHWESAQRVVELGSVALGLVVAFVPRRRDLISIAALAAAVLIAFQLAVTHWFYLYIVWFLPLVLVAVLAEYDDPEPAVAPG